MFRPLRCGFSSLILVSCALSVSACLVCGSAARAGEAKEAELSFDMPDSLVLSYRVLNQMDQSYGGTDVRMNQTWDVDMSLVKRTEEGCQVRLAFIKTTSSLVQGSRLVEWQPPLKLQGASIDATVTPGGKIVAAEPGGAIQGFPTPRQLKDAVQPWFIDLPDTVVEVGATWKSEIVEGKKEGAEPDMAGTVTYTLKKLERKGDLDVAVIEGKVKLKINMATPTGELIADGDGSVKATIAVAGGYVVECKQTLDIRGNTITRDPLTDKEKKEGTAVTKYVECKLQQ